MAKSSDSQHEKQRSIRIAVSPAVYERIEKAARMDERPVAVFCRRAVMQIVDEMVPYVPPPPPPPPAPPAPKVFPKRAPFYIDGELIGEVTLNAHGHMNMQENTPFLNKHVVPMGIPFRALIPLAMRTPVGEDGCLRFVIAGEAGASPVDADGGKR